MPAFTNEQINDRDTANLVAYFRSLPPVAVAGPYLVPVPPNATKGQQLHIAAVGCGQCHGVLFGGPRRDAGAIDADFAWFAGLAYEHTKTMLKHQDVIGEARTPVRMGNYSRSRLPESVLADIWSDIVRPGFVHRSRRGWVRARTRLTASLTQSLSRIGGCKARV